MTSSLDSLKAKMILEDAWREEGGLMDKGPFAAPVTFVRAQELKRDETSGETLLRLVPVHADKVHYEIGGPATTGSALVPDFQKFITTDLRLSFLAVDSTDQHQTGPAIAWQNRISLKSRFSQQGSQRMCELLAAPPVPIFDTTKESYEFLAKLEKSGAEILGPRVMVGSSPWAEFTTDASTSLNRAALEKILHPLREIVGAGEVQLSCDGLSFSSGQDLLDWVSDHRTEQKEHFAIREVAKSDTGAEPGRAWLKAEVKDYWSHRKTLIALLQYLARFQHSLPTWEIDAKAAALLAGALENDH